MITGRLPFEGDFEQAIIYAIMNSDPEPATGVRSNVPVELDRVLMKMLAKDPAERYQNVQEIPVDLRAIKAGLKSGSSGTTRISVAPARPAAVTPPSRNRLLPWVLAVVLALVAVLAFWAPWRSPRLRTGETRFSLTVPSGDLLNIVAYRAVAISPDGRRVVFRSSSGLYLRDMESLEPSMIPGTENASSPFFSPDSRWLAFFAEGKLKKVALSGGAPVTLADAPDNRGGTWSRDGTIIFSASTTEGLSRVSESGGPVEALTVRDTSRMERTHRWPSVFPDGKSVVYTVGSMDSPDYYDDATIEVFNVESGERRAVVQGASTARFALPGYLLYSRAGVLFAVEFDPGSLEVRSAPVPVLEGVIGDPTSGAMNYAVSEDGVLAYIPGDVQGGERSLVLLDMEGNATPYPAPPGSYAEPRMSRDGKRVCLVMGAGKDYDIWVYDILRGTLSRLTFGGTNRTPHWSPDGKYIAYWSVDAGANRGINRKAADGSGAAEKLYGGQERTYIDDWSRDGSVMVLDLVSGQGQASDITLLQLTGEKTNTPFIATKFDEWQSSLSPDGRWLAYISNESGTYQVYVVPFPDQGGKWQISTAGGLEPHWAPDGSKLYYHNAGQMMVVDVDTRPSFSASQHRVLFNGYRPLLMDSGISYDITPDGRHILTTRSSREELLQNVNIVVNWTGTLERVFGGRK
jgi:Tol biopolymer transport system component